MDKALVKKATANTPEPTMGHLYRDIAQMTFTDGKIAQKLVDFLMERLKAGEKKGIHQMIKVLKVMKHSASHGHTDFQKGLQKRCDDLRSYANWRGAPDPVYGQSLNEQVQVAAREAIDACFREQTQSNVTNSLQGIGGGAVEKVSKDPNGFDTFGSGGIGVIGQGGGNKFKEEWAKANGVGEKSAFSKMTGALGKMTGYGGVSENHENLAKKFETQAPPAGGYSGINLAMPVAEAAPQAPAQPFKFLTEGAGGGATAVAVKDENVALNEAQEVVDKAVAVATIGRAERSRFQREVVALQEQDLGDDVNARLDEKLAQKMPWQMRLNALLLIEGLVKAGNEEVKDYFVENPEDIYRNVTVVQTSLKEMAKKTLAALGLPAKRANDKPAKVPQMTSTPEQPALTTQGSSEDLRGGRRKKATGGITRKRGKAEAAVAAEVTPEQSAGLFAALSTMPAAPEPAPPAGAAPAAAPAAASLFAFTQAAPAAAPEPAAAPPAASPFAFTQAAAPAAPAIPAQPAPAAAAPAPPPPAPAAAYGMDLDDLFGAPAPARSAPPAPVSTSADPLGFGAAAEAPQPARSAAFDLFADMAPAPAVPAAPVAPVAPQAPKQDSGFLDLFGGAATQRAPAPAPAAPTPAPAAAAAPQPPRSDSPFGGLFGNSAPAAPAPAAAPVAPAPPPVAQPPKILTAAEIAAITDPAERMRVIQEQQALLASQIAALQGR